MRKFRASMEPFQDLKFSENVEYIVRVSSEYLTSSVLPSLTSSDGRTSRVLQADVILWIYIDSPALYITCTMSSVPPDQSSCTALLSSSSSFETFHYQGQEPLSEASLRLRHQHRTIQYSELIILTTFTTHNFPLCSYRGHGQVFHYHTNIMKNHSNFRGLCSSRYHNNFTAYFIAISQHSIGHKYHRIFTGMLSRYNNGNIMAFSKRHDFLNVNESWGTRL